MRFPLLLLLGPLLAFGANPEPGREVLEDWLARDPDEAFPSGKGARPAFVYGPFEVAYRLMRLYAAQGDWEKMEPLARRMARSEPPFDRYRSAGLHDLGHPEWGNAALALAIDLAPDVASLESLKADLQGSEWIGAQNQLKRRLSSQIAEPRSAVPWANVPPGPTLLVSDENVCSLARDDRYVYSGHPWWVGVWDFSGRLLTRIALGDSADKLAVAGGAVWAGTPRGLFCLRPPASRGPQKSWQVERLAIKRPRPHPDAPKEEAPILEVAADGNRLWIGTPDNVLLLDGKTRELRNFSSEELKVPNGGRFERILPAGRYVWAQASSQGLRRYDRETDEWAVLPDDVPGSEVCLIGIADGRVFGSVDDHDPNGTRLCQIDPETLELSLLPMIEDLREKLPFQHAKRIYRQGLLSVHKVSRGYLFGTNYLWDPKKNRLLDLDDEPLQFSQKTPGYVRENKDDPFSNASRVWHHKRSIEEHLGVWLPGDEHLIHLPNGDVVLGFPRGEVKGDRAATEDASWPRAISSQEGGLFFATGTEAPRRVSASAQTGGLPGDRVSDVIFDGPAGRMWVITDGGLALWDGVHGVTQTYSRTDGLLANCITGGLKKGAYYYFSAAWGKSEGGLIRYDPRKDIFTSYFVSDGLATGRVRSLKDAGESLIQIDYGHDRRESETPNKYRQFPPGLFNGETQQFLPAEPFFLIDPPKAPNGGTPQRPEMTGLGGGIPVERGHDGRTFQCGTRGLVVLPKEKNGVLTFGDFGAKPMSGLREKQLAELEKRPVRITSPADLRKALRDPNPFYRAEAVAAIPAVGAEYLESLGVALQDPNARIRSTALCQIFYAQPLHKDAVPFLRGLLKDPESNLRALAAQTLCLAGAPPAAELQPVLKSRSGYHNFPFGAKGSAAQTYVTKETLCEAVAPHANAEVFAVLAPNPPRWGDNENSTKIFPALGESLRRHPEAVSVVLGTQVIPYDENEWDFPLAVLLSAGPDLLPRVQESLSSANWVERRSAARVCEAFGDPSSVPFLRQALAREDTWPQKQMIRALAKLQGAEALPDIVAAYWKFRKASDARMVEMEFSPQYFLPPPPAYSFLPGRRSEEDFGVLRVYYDTIAALAAPGSREFFQTLCKDRDVSAREEAARQLTTSGDEWFLTILADDPHERVQTAAMFSLAILGDEATRRKIVENLRSPEQGVRSRAFSQLEKIAALQPLDFATAALQERAQDDSVSENERNRARQLLSPQTQNP
jgi:HEAT repeat protein